MKNKSSFYLIIFALILFSSCGGQKPPTFETQECLWSQNGEIRYSSLLLKHPQVASGTLPNYDVIYKRTKPGGLDMLSLIYGGDKEQTMSVIKVTTVANGGNICLIGVTSKTDVFTKDNFQYSVHGASIDHLSNPYVKTNPMLSNPQRTVEIKSGLHKDCNLQLGYVVWSKVATVNSNENQNGTFVGTFKPETLGSIRLYKNGNFIIM